LTTDVADRMHDMVRSYERELYRYAYRWVHTREDAEDVVQDAFEKAWRFRRLDEIQHERAWLYAITLRVIYNRNRKKTLITVPLGDDLRVVAEGAEDDLLRRVAVGRALAELSLAQRELIWLRYQEGFTDTEIGIIVGCPPGTVKSALNRTRKRLEGSPHLDGL
jgi:RNA polymerase sigma-70 factor (ECF subfamily)